MAVLHCSPAWQLLTAILVISAVHFMFSVCEIATFMLSISRTVPPTKYTVSVIIRMFGLASVTVMIVREESLYFSIFSKLFLISYLLAEVS
jgi:hypothetical protein